jgi:ATP/maltotriose-dependent transcriptional regulator MalT
MVLAREGTEAARRLVAAALPEGPGTRWGNDWFVPVEMTQRLAVAVELAAGDLRRAQEWLTAHDRWLAWAGAVPGQSEGQALWARYHWQTGEMDTARAHAERALAHATEPRQPLALLQAQRLLGQLDTVTGRVDAADSHLQRALDLATRCEAPFEQALTLLALAELRAVTGDTATARQSLHEVRAICEPLSAKPTLARVDALVARLDAASPATPSYPAGLSGREVEVLRLVAQGLTNPQVAERLYLSPRTVEQHLRSIYNKLGVSTRAAATAFAVQHGLTGQ